MIGFPCAEESMLSHFDTIPQHDRRADERTDRQTMLSISRVSITVLMRDKNSVGSSVNEKNFKTGLPPIGLSLQFIVASKASRAELLLIIVPMFCDNMDSSAGRASPLHTCGSGGIIWPRAVLSSPVVSCFFRL